MLDVPKIFTILWQPNNAVYAGSPSGFQKPDPDKNFTLRPQRSNQPSRQQAYLCDETVMSEMVGKWLDFDVMMPRNAV